MLILLIEGLKNQEAEWLTEGANLGEKKMTAELSEWKLLTLIGD